MSENLPQIQLPSLESSRADDLTLAIEISKREEEERRRREVEEEEELRRILELSLHEK